MDSSLRPRYRHLFRHRRARERAHVNVGRAENRGQSFTPRPLRPRTATVEVERDHAMLGIGVTREMRFAEDDEAGDAARRGERVEDGLADGMEIEVVNELVEESPEGAGVRQRLRVTSRRIDQPLRADVHYRRDCRRSGARASRPQSAGVPPDDFPCRAGRPPPAGEGAPAPIAPAWFLPGALTSTCPGSAGIP